MEATGFMSFGEGVSQGGGVEVLRGIMHREKGIQGVYGRQPETCDVIPFGLRGMGFEMIFCASVEFDPQHAFLPCVG